jgi:hypothetical protein
MSTGKMISAKIVQNSQVFSQAQRRMNFIGRMKLPFMTPARMRKKMPANALGMGLRLGEYSGKAEAVGMLNVGRFAGGKNGPAFAKASAGGALEKRGDPSTHSPLSGWRSFAGSPHPHPGLSS